MFQRTKVVHSMVFDKLPTAFLNGIKHVGIFKNRKYGVEFVDKVLS